MTSRDDEKMKIAIEVLAGLSAEDRRKFFEEMKAEGRETVVLNYATESLSKLDDRIEQAEKMIDKLEDSREAGKSVCYSCAGVGVTMSTTAYVLGGVLEAAFGFGAVTAMMVGVGGLQVRAEGRKIKKEQERLMELKEERKLMLSVLAPSAPAPGHPSSLLKLASSFNPAPKVKKSPDLPPDTRPKPPEQNR